MIQGLFALIFLSTFCPVAIKLCLNAKEAEQNIALLGKLGRFLVATVMVLLTTAQLGWLNDISAFMFVRLVNSAGGYLISLPIHEFGHFLFMPLGEVMMVLGGSLFQVVLPLLLFLWFLRKQCPTLSCIFLFLAGLQLIDVSRYMGSSRNRGDIILLSIEQDPNSHDWFQLFSWWGMLEKDTVIASVTCSIGTAIAAFAIGFLFYFSRKQAATEN